MCELLVGLGEVNVLAVDGGDATAAGGPLRVVIESRLAGVCCGPCGSTAHVKDRAAVELVDLGCFGRPTRLVWRKHRWRCPNPDCERGSWTHTDRSSAWGDDSARWTVGDPPGRRRWPHGQRCRRRARRDWHTVKDAVIAYGAALLEADLDRVGATTALGLDETLFNKTGPWRRQRWATSVVDLGGDGRRAVLVDLIEGRTANKVLEWLDGTELAWQAGILAGAAAVGHGPRTPRRDRQTHPRWAPRCRRSPR